MQQRVRAAYVCVSVLCGEVFDLCRRTHKSFALHTASAARVPLLLGLEAAALDFGNAICERAIV